jgi:hypothetical protein
MPGLIWYSTTTDICVSTHEPNFKTIGLDFVLQLACRVIGFKIGFELIWRTTLATFNHA